MQAHEETVKFDHFAPSAEADDPAGPLFTGGEFAKADIVGSAFRSTQVSICTGSHTIACC